MSSIGFSELIILFVIGLIVLGPERLPRVANQLGGWIGQARRMTRMMKQQLEDELDLEKELRIQPPALQAPHDDTATPATGAADEKIADEQSADERTTAEPRAGNRTRKNDEMTGGERDE